MIRATTRLVEVNAIVHDQKGNTVAGIQKDDFEIFEDGKQQHIAIYVPEKAEPMRQRILPPQVFSNQLQVQTGARTGYTVILLDWLNGLWRHRAFVRQQVIRLLR